MKHLKITTAALVFLAVLSCQSDSENQKSYDVMGMSKVADTTIAACKLTDAEQAKRSERLRQELFSKVQDVKELDDGFALQVPAKKAMMDKVMEHVWIERQCCPFFEFEITMEQDEGPVWLKFRGGKQVKELLKADMAELKKAI